MTDLLKCYSTHNRETVPLDKWLKIQDRLRVNVKYKEVVRKIREKIPKTKL